MTRGSAIPLKLQEEKEFQSTESVSESDIISSNIRLQIYLSITESNRLIIR